MVVMAHGYESFGWSDHAFDRAYIWQLPPTRLVLDGGYLAVNLLFVTSGYLCAIKPLRLIRAGKPEEARSLIGQRGFRRIIRLTIPTNTATIISWFLANVGGFDTSIALPNYVWLNFHSGWPSPTWAAAFRQLWYEIVSATPVSALIVASYLDVRWGDMEHGPKWLRGDSMVYGCLTPRSFSTLPCSSSDRILSPLLPSSRLSESHCI